MFSFAMGGLSAMSLGTADFIASQGAERIGAPRALAGMLFISSLALTLVMMASGGFEGLFVSRNIPAILYSVLHGVTLSLALLLFFHAMSVGQISVVAPIVAAHPVVIVLFHTLRGAPLPTIQVLAVLGALAGVALVGGAARDCRGASFKGKTYAPLRTTIMASVAASLIYGVAIVLLQCAANDIEDHQILWLGRVAGLAAVGTVLLLPSTNAKLPPWRWWGVFTVHGSLDSAGLLFILWGTNGSASDAVTAVVASTFPVITTGLALLLLRERLNAWQILGAITAFACIAVLAGHSRL